MSLTAGFLSADEIFLDNRYSLWNPNTLYLFHLEMTLQCSLQTFSEILMDFSEGEIGNFGGFMLMLFRACDGNRTLSFPRCPSPFCCVGYGYSLA